MLFLARGGNEVKKLLSRAFLMGGRANAELFSWTHSDGRPLGANKLTPPLPSAF